jgi:DNA-binding beta-propeller fold protein YncE
MLSKSHSIHGILLLSLFFLLVSSCKHSRGGGEIIVDDGGYPTEVNRIIMLHCTTGAAGGGCHNAVGAENSGGLRMDTWDNLFYGTRHGAAVVPFDTLNSSLLHYINIDSNLGSIALPTMPFNQTPLTKAEFLTIRNWVARGAPDKNGNIPFADEADTRQKMYLTNQASDMISVIDAARYVIMRNIPIGTTNAIESPHCVRLSLDGQFAYVSFLAGDYIQKIDTRTDKVVAQAQVSNGNAQWNVLSLSADGTRLVASDLARGWLRIINTSTMQVVTKVGEDAAPSSPFKNPHGIATTPAFDTIYMTGQYGNTVFKFTPDFSFLRYISIDGNPPNYSVGTRDPHEIMLTPDGSKYFLTCEASNEVRVMDARKDTLIAVFPVPAKPQEIALATSKPYMLITCMEGATSIPGAKGAVVVINYETMQLVKTIEGPFWQPHGIAVDDKAGTFYVVSTNIGGPFSGHNHTKTSGKAGWYNVYNLSTLDLVNTRQYETLAQPYSADTRFR